MQSFAFGVPYVTSKDAISGGEKFNIISGHNGFLIDQNIKSFVSIFQSFTNGEVVYEDLGKNAYQYYKDHASIENMCCGFCRALEYKMG